MGPKLAPEVIAGVRAKLVASDWRNAAALCRESLVSYPSSCFLLSSAHKAAVQLGELEEARRYIERALTAAPDVAAYHLLSGRLYQKVGDHDSALASYKQAAALAPSVASHHAAIGAVLYARQRYLEAIRGYQAALALDPSQVGWWNRLARSASLAGDLSLAVEAYAASLELKEDFVVLAASMEVQRQLAAGLADVGEASARYYDAIFRGSAKYAQHGNLSEYVGVWREIIALLRAAKICRVLDLGCGPGQFAEYLKEHATGVAYMGVDFSQVAIQQARVRCPEFQFEVVSLPNSSAVERLDCDGVVCTEVLEHLDQDCSLIESIPDGVFVVATVPNFDSFGHVRYFSRADQVVQRYRHLFSSLTVIPVALSSSSMIWLFHGHRKSHAIHRDASNSDLQSAWRQRPSLSQ